MGQLEKPPTLAELVALRDGMVEDARTIEEAKGRLYTVARRFDFHLTDLGNRSTKDHTKDIDVGFWRYTLEHTGIIGAMTEKAKREYLDRLEKKPPAFTLKALADLAQNADRIYSSGFEQTIAEVRRTFLASSYEGGSWRDKKVDNLQRIERQFRTRGPIYWDPIMQKFYCREGGKFDDLLTACHLLDGRPRPTSAERFYAIAYDGARAGVNPIVTPYFSVKYHKNGNHLVTWNPAKEEILDRLNAWGQQGNTLGDALKKRYKPEHFANDWINIEAAGERFDGGPDLQFYPTPPELVARMLEWADLRPGLRCLEPEIGDGAIGLAMLEIVLGDEPIGEGGVQGFEIDHARAVALSSRNLPGLHVENVDFLKVKPETWGQFDRIVMNPPFSRQADALHVLHAIRFLRHGGGLVSVMAAGIESSQTRTAKALRGVVRAWGGRFEENPPDSFRQAGTRVRTVTLVIPAKNED